MIRCGIMTDMTAIIERGSATAIVSFVDGNRIVGSRIAGIVDTLHAAFTGLTLTSIPTATIELGKFIAITATVVMRSATITDTACPRLGPATAITAMTVAM